MVMAQNSWHKEYDPLATQQKRQGHPVNSEKGNNCPFYSPSGQVCACRPLEVPPSGQ